MCQATGIASTSLTVLSLRRSSLSVHTFFILLLGSVMPVKSQSTFVRLLLILSAVWVWYFSAGHDPSVISTVSGVQLSERLAFLSTTIKRPSRNPLVSQYGIEGVELKRGLLYAERYETPLKTPVHHNMVSRGLCLRWACCMRRGVSFWDGWCQDSSTESGEKKPYHSTKASFAAAWSCHSHTFAASFRGWRIQDEASQRRVRVMFWSFVSRLPRRCRIVFESKFRRLGAPRIIPTQKRHVQCGYCNPSFLTYFHRYTDKKTTRYPCWNIWRNMPIYQNGSDLRKCVAIGSEFFRVVMHQRAGVYCHIKLPISICWGVRSAFLPISICWGVRSAFLLISRCWEVRSTFLRSHNLLRDNIMIISGNLERVVLLNNKIEFQRYFSWNKMKITFNITFFSNRLKIFTTNKKASFYYIKRFAL